MTDQSRDYFEIHHCINCNVHAWCTRHDQAQYTGKAHQLKEAIEAATGARVDVNGGANPVKDIAVGALEVYYKGIRVYSKIMSRRWPNAAMVADKCKRLLDASNQGEDINEFEHIPVKKQQINNFFDAGATDYMSMRTSTRGGPHARLPSIGSHYPQFEEGTLGGTRQKSINLNMSKRASHVCKEQPDERNRKFKVVGRPISLGECQFIFKRIWAATLKACNHKEDNDHYHPDEERDPNEVHLNDLFHVIDLAGKLLNKKEPDEDDTTPYDEFMKYAKTVIVAEHEDGEHLDLQYVEVKYMPQLIFASFVSQPDEKRIDAAELLEKFVHSGENKQIISHLVDQIWSQYDKDGNGSLDQEESRSFIRMALTIHEKTTAATLNRDCRLIPQEDVDRAIEECDRDHDGKITKDEMNNWLVTYMQNHDEYKCEHPEMIKHISGIKSQEPPVYHHD